MKKWWVRGLFYGTGMFLFMKILFPLAEGEKLVFKELILGFVIWVAIGLIFGLGITEFINSQEKGKSVSNQDHG